MPTTAAPGVARIIIEGVIVIQGSDFGLLIDHPIFGPELARSVREDIANLLSIILSRVLVRSLTLGSLVVDYAVTGTGSETGAEILLKQETLRATAGQGGWLSATSSLYRNVSNETLVVSSATAQAPADEGGSCSSFASGDCPWFIFLISVLGALLILTVVICTCRICNKRKADALAAQKAAAEPYQEEMPRRNPITTGIL